MKQEELINSTARKFINSPDVKEGLDAPTRMWLEQHIVILLEGFAKELKPKKGKT